MNRLLYFEKGKPYHQRRKLGKVFFVWCMLFLSLSVTSIVLELPEIYSIAFEVCFLILLWVYMANGIVKMIFLNSYKNSLDNKQGLSFEAAVAKDKGKKLADDVFGFIASAYGYEVMKRLGISKQSLEHYLERRVGDKGGKPKHLPHGEIIQNKKWIDLQHYASYLHDHDDHFAQYLRTQNVNKSDLLYSALLVHNMSALQKQQDRFWSSKKLHDMDDFEIYVIDKEGDHNTYVTSPAIKLLDSLDLNEKESMLDKILKHAKQTKLPVVHVGDIRNFIDRQ